MGSIRERDEAGSILMIPEESYLPYDTHQPYSFFDLFEFGYEATGEVDSWLDSDWQNGNDTSVVYYLRVGKVRGVMMCNVWDKVEAARKLIRKGDTMTHGQLRGLIR